MKPRALREVLGEPGVLYDRGPATCQVAGRALAEPSAARRRVDVLGHAELGARRLDVALIFLGRRRDRCGRAHAPAVASQLVARAVAAERQFEIGARASRQLEDLHHLGTFAPEDS